VHNDIEILSPNKNFANNFKEKIIDYDDNLAKDIQLENENDLKCKPKPKKPYLKRGTGLARYGLNLDEVKKKSGKLKFHKPIKSVPSKIKVQRKCLNQAQKFPKTEFGNFSIYIYIYL